jgi:hypothetical protein
MANWAVLARLEPPAYAGLVELVAAGQRHYHRPQLALLETHWAIDWPVRGANHRLRQHTTSVSCEWHDDCGKCSELFVRQLILIA